MSSKRRRGRHKPKYLTLDLETRGPARPATGVRVEAFWGSPAEPVANGAAVLAASDQRRAAAPPDFEADEAWTWSAVEFGFRGALRVMAALPSSGRDGPGQMRAAWPDWVRDYAGEAIARRARPTPRQIDQAELLLRFLSAVEPERVRRGLTAYCAGLKWPVIKKIADDHRSPYHLRGRVYRAAMQEIADRLNDEKKIRLADVAEVPFFGL